MTRRVYASAAARFDERRNTSRVFVVHPDALEQALAALAKWKRDEPAAYEWVASGVWRRPL